MTADCYARLCSSPFSSCLHNYEHRPRYILGPSVVKYVDMARFAGASSFMHSMWLKRRNCMFIAYVIICQ